MKATVVLILLLASLNLHATQRALTDEGQVVILHDDGTWEAEGESRAESTEIAVNNAVFKKPAAATFDVKSTRNRSVVAIDPKTWSFSKSKDAGATEYTFQLKGQDLYGMLISEQIEIGIEALAKLALTNARNAAKDTKVTKKEYRIVNGNKLVYMEMRGTIESVDFTYRGYYSSNKGGTTQLVTYTGSTLVEKFAPQINDFLNGLGVQP